MEERFESGLTTKELELAAIMKMLSTGITSLGGGDRLEKWLTEHKDKMKGGFGTYNVLYLRFDKTMKLLAIELTNFLKTEEIGSEVRWVKTKDSPENEWLLQIYWE